MSFVGKLKKFGSFAGKVAKGLATGGVRGAIVAGVTNLGGGKSKQAQAKAFAGDPYRQSAQTYAVKSATISVDDGQTMDKKKKTWTILGIVAGAVVLVLVLFKKKRR